MIAAPSLWTNCYFWLETCRCFEWTKTGTCGCVSHQGRYKGTNPCQRTQDILDDIDAHSRNQEPPHGHNPQDILDFMLTRTCHPYRGGHCNHRKCNDGTELFAFIRSLIRRKAA